MTYELGDLVLAIRLFFRQGIRLVEEITITDPRMMTSSFVDILMNSHAQIIVIRTPRGESSKLQMYFDISVFLA